MRINTFPTTVLLTMIALAGQADVQEIEREFRSVYEQQAGKKYIMASADLDLKYVEALERALMAATQGGRLEEAIVIREEIRRMRASESLGNDGKETPAELAPFKKTYREHRDKLTAERNRLTAPILAKFSEALAAYQEELTKSGMLDEALTVKSYREGNLAEKLTGEPMPPISQTEPAGLVAATKEAPFINSLGMPFVPVPGTQVLFCIHEVRWRDYSAYAKANSGVAHDWRNQTISEVRVTRNEDHPVMRVSWEDAVAFCKWLSAREGKTYRLPSDDEWSLAVGSTGENAAEFPWGVAWPPPPGAGNYQDESRKKKAPHPQAVYLDGYDDGLPTTGPVKSFPANTLGIFDLGGNVWEWCGDGGKAGGGEQVYRGGSWSCGLREFLVSSAHGTGKSDERFSDVGFRIVVEK